MPQDKTSYTELAKKKRNRSVGIRSLPQRHHALAAHRRNTAGMGRHKGFWARHSLLTEKLGVFVPWW